MNERPTTRRAVTQAEGRARLARALRGGDFPLSFAQQRLWFLDQLDPGTSAYTIAARRRFTGPLDRAALTSALTELVRRHESLRTTFPSAGGEPVQRIADPEPVALDHIDLEPVPQEERAAALWRAIQELVHRPFDLTRGPLFRPVLIALGPEEHELLLVLHHIVADGWSLGILARELAELYEAGRAGRTPSLPKLLVQYADFALWQRQWLAGEPLESQRRYWHGQLRGQPAPLELPTDHPRPHRLTAAGASHDFALPRPLADRLRELSRRERATLFMTLQAAFKALLARYSSQEDILIGTPVANRTHLELESVIGFFANTLVLRTALTGDPTFRQLLARVRETCLGAYAHADMPFEKLVEELHPQRVLGQNPLFQVGLVMQDAATSADLTFVSVASPFDLTLFVCEGSDGTLRATIQYKRELFEPDTIARLARHYRTLLDGVAADPDRRLSTLSLLETPETHQLLIEWNATTTPYPRDRSVHGLLGDQVDATPDALALVFEGGSLTYRELDCRANRLAHYLRVLGVGPDSRVGMWMERSADLIVSLLGVLKAGAGYVPLDRLAPPERLAFMLADARVDAVLTQTEMLARLPATGVRAICVDTDGSAIAGQPDTRLESRVGADGLAYIMYTSGSTGTPKGVAVSHRSVVRLVRGTDYVHFGPDEVFLQLAPASFDPSTFEIWGALLNGGRLAVAPPGVLSAEELGVVLARHGVTTLTLAAGLFEQVVDARVEVLRPLRQLLVGGDVLSPPHVRRVLTALPGLRLINGYGPTEGTTLTCCHAVSSAPPPGRSVPIGRPIANTRVYILDRHRQPVPIGVAGELWIAGDGLACGYVDRPDLTAQYFVVQRLSEGLEERLYRSGDLARWLRDGTLEFLGRLDDQVKVRGFRVELGEIQAALALHPRVRESVVVTRRMPAGEKDLIAYVAGPGPEDSQEIRALLGRKLPEYMIPAVLVVLDRLPLTPNGKVDRRALPDPEVSGGPAGDAIEPRDELERQLVAIWQEVLSVGRVGVRDSFFDLGGHSLLAVRMFARLEEQVRVRLPLATLFQTPTIEGLAAVIRAGMRPAPGRSLVAIQPRGSRPPLFGMPGVGGSVLSYSDLARHLAPNQPFYGLQSRGVDGLGTPLTRIEDIAAEFLREIREIQPDGPYYLAGACMGGVVAYEMAQQLCAAGEKIGLLALLETWPPMASPERRPRLSARTLAYLELARSRLRLYAEMLVRLRGHERMRYLGQRIKLLAKIAARRDLFREARMELYSKIVTQANTLALTQYRPRVYPGPVVLFCAGGRNVPAGDDYRLGWRELAAGGLDVYTVSGDDSGLMLAEPNVRLVAGHLKRCIERAHTLVPRARPG